MIRENLQLSFLNNRRIDADPTLHNVENNLKLMHGLGLKTTGKEKYDIPVQGSTSFVDRFLVERNINSSDLKVGIHPGSDKRGKDRRLDISKFVEICDHLVDKYGAKVFIFLGPHEEDLKKHILSLSKKEQYVIIEKMDIHNVAQLISMCHIFISSDSGLMHIASVYGGPNCRCIWTYKPCFCTTMGCTI